MKLSHTRSYPCRFAPVLAFMAMLSPLRPQQPQRSAPELLRHALHLADLYNWGDAGSEFSEAETMFLAAGDQRNALYAGLGKLRANIEQLALPATSAKLAADLDTNPLLQTDKQLRMFCLIVKGDVDGEIDSKAMGQDWEQVRALARDLGDAKWQYRAQAQLGLAAFYDGDLATARMNVGGALLAAAKNGDAGAQIRYLTALGIGLRESHMYEESLPYFDKASKIASATPDAGYPFLTNVSRLEALVGLRQYDPAQHLADDILAHAQQQHRSQRLLVLNVAARIARARKDDDKALAILKQAIALAGDGGYVRQLSGAQSLLADLYRDHGDLEKAVQFATLAAETAQECGDAWSAPQDLQKVAELLIRQGKYAEADRVYDRAAALVDSMIGNYSSVLEKTALIRASSELYAQHFSFVAERFKNSAKAYAIIEQVRGRVSADLLLAGSVTSDEAKKNQQDISRLRLKLATAHSTGEVHRIRDQIFLLEQSRWITPEISILKAQSHNTINIDTVQRSLHDSTVLLEYVVADPRSYCLVVSRAGSRIVPLAGKQRIDTLVAAYLKAVKAKQVAQAEARQLYDALLRPVSEAAVAENLIVVRDGRLHLAPFDAFIDPRGRYVVETHNVVYAPSATSFYLLATQQHQPHRFARTLLAVGGIPYNPAEVNQASVTRGYDASAFSDLPASKDEVLAAEAAVHDPNSTLLIGTAATKSAFKRADLAQYRIIHLAVHGFASTTDQDRSALVLLSDPASGEDGFLQASEIVQLRLNADLVILSACDTAVGPVQGEEGIATLSRAFLLAGARTVVSTLWSIDDTFSLFLMKQFYKHLAAGEPASHALTAAKRDMLQKYGRAAVPYYWAGFTLEGVSDHGGPFHVERQEYSYVTDSKKTH